MINETKNEEKSLSNTLAKHHALVQYKIEKAKLGIKIQPESKETRIKQ